MAANPVALIALSAGSVTNGGNDSALRESGCRRLLQTQQSYIKRAAYAKLDSLHERKGRWHPTWNTYYLHLFFSFVIIPLFS